MENVRFSPVGLILLAAGASRRLGQSKQLLYYEGKTLLRRTAETAVMIGCGPLVVVTGALRHELADELAGLPATLVHTPRWAMGVGTSVGTGLAALQQVCPTVGGGAATGRRPAPSACSIAARAGCRSPGSRGTTSRGGL